MTGKIIGFHGSPGGDFDFDLLSQAMKEDIHSSDTQIGDNDIVLGYSYGCRRAIAAISQSQQPQALILVAPFIFVEEVSFLKKLILKAPFIGDFLLKKTAPKAIDSFLIQSSAPCEVPAGYKAARQLLLNPEQLKQSITEKKSCDNDELKKIECPTLLIWGEGDLTSSFESQVSPLLSILPQTKSKKIENAGHALVWTHPQEISRIIKEYKLTTQNKGMVEISPSL